MILDGDTLNVTVSLIMGHSRNSLGFRLAEWELRKQSRISKNLQKSYSYLQ